MLCRPKSPAAQLSCINGGLGVGLPAGASASRHMAAEQHGVVFEHCRLVAEAADVPRGRARAAAAATPAWVSRAGTAKRRLCVAATLDT